MTNSFEASYIIKIKGATQVDNQVVTSQMMRDKLIQPLQEMWLLGHIKSFTLEEVDQRAQKKWKRSTKKVK